MTVRFHTMPSAVLAGVCDTPVACVGPVASSGVMSA